MQTGSSAGSSGDPSQVQSGADLHLLAGKIDPVVGAAGIALVAADLGEKVQAPVGHVVGADQQLGILVLTVNVFIVIAEAVPCRIQNQVAEEFVISSDAKVVLQRPRRGEGGFFG